ncbi:MAG: hypothetical protein ABFR97_09575 [Thermodesulfobacteriota bacterium]
MQSRKVFMILGGCLVMGIGLSACGGSSGSSSGSSAPNASPGGIWSGQITYIESGQTIPAYGFCTEAGELRFLSEDGEQTTGVVTVSGNSFTATITSYAPLGYVFPPYNTTVLSGTASGNINERNALTGSAVFMGQTASTFSLSYEPIYERGSNLADIAGTYTVNELNYSSTYTIDSNGVLTGNNSDGCQIAGTVGIIDNNYNMYRINMTVSACNMNDTYIGLAALLDEGGGENDTLAISVSGNSYVLSVTVPRQ